MPTYLGTLGCGPHKLGKDLTPADQKHALRAYVHRYTGDHTPAWAKHTTRPDGREYVVQFRDDAEWLANTFFRVRNDGTLAVSVYNCESHPTWPNNPELRPANAADHGMRHGNHGT